MFRCGNNKGDDPVVIAHCVAEKVLLAADVIVLALLSY